MVKYSHRRSKGAGVLAIWLAVVGWLALFVFFQCFYRNHLCHREQFTLFVWAAEPLRAYWSGRAPLARLAGDFLTQFLGLNVVGPLIMTLVLTALGVLTYRLLVIAAGHAKRRQLAIWWALVIAVLFVCLETGRQCGLTYPLSSTLQLVGIVATVLIARRRKSVVAMLVILAVGIWLFGWGDWEKRAVNRPDMRVEHMLAVDNDWYHGRDISLQRRLDSQAGKDSRFDTYYQNLLWVSQYRLGDELMQYYQPFQLGLFLPVEATASYQLAYMSGELWFQLGDMTNAEHSVMLGMIFSPNSTGSRPLKRLVEINLIRGDEAAAMKYLRLLDKTLLYHRWAQMHIPQNRPKAVERWLDMKRTLLCTTDTVRAPLDIGCALRHLVEDNPDNVFARDYLFSFDLLAKDIDAFRADYLCYQPDGIPPQRVWSEALLLWIASHGQKEREMSELDIPMDVANAFVGYMEEYGKIGTGILPADRQVARLQQKYGNTYWFFYHFASYNEK